MTIGAASERIWPWIVQMGYGRAGWYSYDRAEQAVGAGEFAEGRSARRIVPELQGLAVGDRVPLSQNGGPVVVSLDPLKSLILHYRMDLLSASPVADRTRLSLDGTWVFVLRAIDGGCRLIVRVRADPAPRWLRVAFPLLEVAHFAMERRMLLGLKERAERQGEASRLAEPVPRAIPAADPP